MKEGQSKIRDLELTQDDGVFFHLFNNFSVFNANSADQRRRNLIVSLGDNPDRILRCAQNKRFYEIAKAPELEAHWQKLLGKNSTSPLDDYLWQHCQDVKQQAKDENNADLAAAYEALAKSYSVEARKDSHETITNSPSPNGGGEK